MAFATSTEIAIRLGQELTETEDGMATQLSELATALIAEAASKDDDWAADLNPVPKQLKAICIEVACRAMSNPGGLSSLREQLGQYSYAQNFRDAGLLLTPIEERIVRRVVHGRTTDSSKVASGFQESEELLRFEQDTPTTWI